jgi:hypothetical protein
MPRISLQKLRVIHTFIRLYRDAETQSGWGNSRARSIGSRLSHPPGRRILDKTVSHSSGHGQEWLAGPPSRLSFIVSTNLSHNPSVEVLSGYQAMTGILALSTPRDAFFTSLANSQFLRG